MSGFRVSGFRPRFFVAGEPDRDPLGTELLLGTEDSHHASTVLRLQPGDECEVVVGAAVYAATVVALEEGVRVRAQARLEGDASGGAYRVRVGLVQALARPAVMDYVFEKGTEVGASFFVLVAAAGSPKWAAASANDRLERWGRIVREAAKQSKQLTVPTVVFTGPVGGTLDHPVVAGLRSVVLEPGASSSLADLPKHVSGEEAMRSALALWVGPEGGWSVDERRLFEARRLSMARLGRGVLRTETAGPVAVAVARLLLGDW
jgi:16S rRNA (uracil1498-N3)-methyltransferase